LPETWIVFDEDTELPKSQLNRFRTKQPMKMGNSFLNQTDSLSGMLKYRQLEWFISNSKSQWV